MASTRSRAAALLVALTALAGCDRSTGTPGPAPSAHAGFGGPTTPAVRDVNEAMFRTPSKNIFCALTPSAVRCDIGQKNWELPSKPPDCELDWGNGLYLDRGAAGLTCAGDTLLNSSTETLEYGSAVRSGSVTCTSESAGLTCKDEKTSHGFTMATARYRLF